MKTVYSVFFPKSFIDFRLLLEVKLLSKEPFVKRLRRTCEYPDSEIP